MTLVLSATSCYAIGYLIGRWSAARRAKRAQLAHLARVARDSENSWRL